MIKGILIDLGDTIIEQRVDYKEPLSSMELIAFPDAQPALAELKAHGYSVAIVSNTFQSSATDVAQALEKLGLLQYIDTVVTSSDVGVEKPHPRMFLTALDNLGLSAPEVAMVGDDIAKDVAGAQRLGIITVFVNRNRVPVDTEETPTLVAYSLGDILPLLKPYLDREKEAKSFEQTTSAISSVEKDDYEQLCQAAQEAKDMLLLDQAARLHFKAANYCLARGDYEKAASHFMRAARCREQDEEWREIGTLWLRVSRALEQAEQPIESKTPYEDYDASQHFFLGIAPESWDTLPSEERIGRAYRYAGYHLEKAGTNQSAYSQYFSAGLVFEASQEWEQAGRAFYLAILSFIRQFGELNKEYLRRLETANRQCILQDEKKFLHRARLYYRRIAAELRRQGNEEDLETMYIEHKEMTRTLARKNGQIGQWLLYTLWRLTSGYGTDFWRWLGWTAILAIGLFPTLYSVFDLLKPRPDTWFESVYFSVAAFVTSSYLDLTPVGWGRLLALSEAVLGLVMLGSLLTLIVNKITR